MRMLIRRVYVRPGRGVAALLVAVATFAATITYAVANSGAAVFASLPNNLPQRNLSGYSATFSTAGAVDLDGAYFQAHGINGRSCGSCHVATDAWSINPGTLQQLFDESTGTHPVFNDLDANNPDLPDDTLEQRLAKYSMLLSRGVFRRGGAPRAGAEWELLVADDPHRFANLTRLVQWRRVMPTINFPVGSATVNWDGGNSIGSDQHAGLVNQATRNIFGAQQRPATSPLPPDVVPNIVAFEESLFTAQLILFGVGRLDDGARGGPEALSKMPKVAGRFDLYDGWAGDPNPRRAQIFRGQEVFNNPNPNGGSCRGCHNAKNNGTNINDVLFDIGTAAAEVRPEDFPLYTIRHRVTGEIRHLTDTGRGNITGLWSDLGKFKTPTLRALAARAPYFHNGMAPTLESVVQHYERQLGFVFTDQERADLIAFLKAL